MIWFAALAGFVLTVSAWPLALNAEYAAREQALEKADAFVQELTRVGKESLLSADDLMLLSYIKNLRTHHPEVAYATVFRNGQVLKFGQGRKDISYREVRASVKDESRSIVLGLDMKMLEKLPAGVPEAPDPNAMSGMGLILMILAGSAAYANSLPKSSSRKPGREVVVPHPREALVGVPKRLPEALPLAIK